MAISSVNQSFVFKASELDLALEKSENEYPDEKNHFELANFDESDLSFPLYVANMNQGLSGQVIWKCP